MATKVETNIMGDTLMFRVETQGKVRTQDAAGTLAMLGETITEGQGHAQRLQREIDAAQTAIEDAIATGANPAAARAEVARLQADLTDMREHIDALEGLADQVREIATDAIAAPLREQHRAAVARIEAALPSISSLDALIAGLEHLEQPMDEHLIERVAAARLALDEANATHAAACAKVTNLERRIRDAEARQSEITNRRLAGESTADETNEFAALNGDLGVLRKLLREAQAAANATDPAEARGALARAEADLREHQQQAEFDAVVEHARHAEAVYIEMLRRVWDAAGQRGIRRRTFGEVFKIAEPLMNLCRLNSWTGLRGT